MHLLLLVALCNADAADLFGAGDADAPTAADICGFPDEETCDAMLEFLRGQRSWLLGQQGVYGPQPWWRDQWQVWIDDNEARIETWDDLGYAWAFLRWAGTADENGDLHRALYLGWLRGRLAVLREKIGAPDFALKVMPACADVRFLPSIDH